MRRPAPLCRGQAPDQVRFQAPEPDRELSLPHSPELGQELVQAGCRDWAERIVRAWELGRNVPLNYPLGQIFRIDKTI
ncbi:MAG TPA: hypothetical protein VLA12_17315 [Planctomycetaceae bacterium]|nr:hypothetical protein [Planctomycetaceae bacterium]